MINIVRLIGGTPTVSGKPNMPLQKSSPKLPSTVVWNTTFHCNMRCMHCYIDAEPTPRPNELSTSDGEKLINDLAEYGVSVLLFSGGEPLLREDIYELALYAKTKGIVSVLSTNGYFINEQNIDKIKKSFAYVGVSIDGYEGTHDKFRGVRGSFKKASEALRLLKDEGVDAGVRYTVTKYNFKDLPHVLEFLEDMGIRRICIYHLVYSGRGEQISSLDLDIKEKRHLVDLLFEKAYNWRNYEKAEILTVNSPVDGVYTLLKLIEVDSQLALKCYEILKKVGGDPTGHRMCAIDPLGNVTPSQFWQELILGNIKDRSFGDIWENPSSPIAIKLRSKNAYVRGKCGACYFREVCGGYRVRALRVYGDIWAEDPACYLSREELERGAKFVELS